ncbi:MAG: 6-O-methylguanine DNA methyltransferase, DNA binding domain subfamily [Candidatus Woesebacteria bacterium GW2011_GWA1_38_8]|uniref:6-O-methylguanine DNA methyltransferase, DNA binding domain subfamily n=1 Tax=Candidatus Woesebacteria bacterium GW2011_GWA1_38_8 TaxID=1618547 RepID=A0A0G0KYX6_9BACT|nr:MAG: 6-O-methylguanine DNA methyltransferase, DNA binding domain subfamily [Candidatus Woesebacteria bacterium GW2011_GWA1_38_8]
MQTPYKKLKVGEIVYEIVKKIPKGKVASYGLISKIANEEMKKLKNEELIKVTPRYIGYLLHNNPDPEKIPCHRVVDRNGKIAENYKFGGWREQKRKLTKEGVKFRDERRVDKKSEIS